MARRTRRAYDNWQRLVEAVMRREHMLELFHAQSRSPSVSSIESDRSSTDHQLLDPSLSRDVFRDTLQSDEKFESRKHVEDEILATLLNNDVDKIGISGIGGIGKTRMAKRIGKTVKEAEMFDQVIMTVVGRQPDIERIQSDIAVALGLKLEEKSLHVSASQLSNAMKGLRSILIILDDVWAGLILEDIGIPSRGGNKRCKIMITTRNEDVLETMQVQKVFPVQALCHDEALSLFKESVGSKAEDLNPLHFAKVLANECKGVPLALGILGLALKGKDERFWVAALELIRRGTPSALPHVTNSVYQPVQLCYMWLSDKAKSLFIHCCAFKEDSDIFVEELVRFGTGLDFLKGIMSLEGARDRVRELIGVLKDHSLLEEGRDPINVKMHDVVRDVAFSIASEVSHVHAVKHNARSINWPDNKKYTHMSLTSTEPIEISEELVCPNLRFLRLQCNLNENLSEGKPLVLPDNFFCRTRNLNVLVVSGIYIESLPPSLQLMTELRTLHLHSCSVKNISFVGQLVNLEILSCYDCPRIEILSGEIGRLNRLRLLELCQCQHLKTISTGVISSLVLLEELKMRGSFAQWQASGRQGKMNASITELESLSHLVSLEIEIEDAEVISAQIPTFSGVTRFYLKVGTDDETSRYIEVPHPYKTIEGEQCMQLSLPDKHTSPGFWIHDFLRRTEDLSLIGNGSFNFVFEEFDKVKKLRFCKCSTKSHLLNTTDEGIFRALESLDLEDLPNFLAVCHSPLPAGSFLNLREIKLYNMPSLLHLWKNLDPDSALVNLKSIDVRNCKVLPYLFTLSTSTSFVQLEELRVLFCGTMTEVLSNDLHKAPASIAFPRLKKLVLNSLPKLVAFSRGIKSMKFPQLEFLSIRNVEKLPGLLPGNGPEHVFFEQGVEFDSLRELSLHGLADTISQVWSLRVPMWTFSELEKLHIIACNKLKNLFSPSIARALVSLRELHIKDSLMMSEVIVNVKERAERTLFPKLERMELSRLRSLRSFCQWKQDLELPSLKHVNICMCPEMQCFSLGPLSTPKLEHFEVENEQVIEFKDLNGAIRAKHKTEASSSSAPRR